MAEELNDRVQRLEEAQRRAWLAIERLSDKQNRLDDALVTLADAQTKMHESQINLQESHIKLHQEMAALSRQTDERIAALVTAIGEFLRARNGR